jgi:hypothetical protein
MPECLQLMNPIRIADEAAWLRVGALAEARAKGTVYIQTVAFRQAGLGFRSGQQSNEEREKINANYRNR